MSDHYTLANHVKYGDVMYKIIVFILSFSWNLAVIMQLDLCSATLHCK